MDDERTLHSLPNGDIQKRKTMDNSSSPTATDPTQILRPETVLLYGVAESISALFLFLSILVHLLVPDLNCRAYSLMCHTVSLFIMFLTYPIRKFIEYDLIGNVIIFIFHYTFGLAAFFWLNVLGFELWKLFSDLRTIERNERHRRSRRRQMFLKSAYAWGLPILFCVLIVLLGFDKEMQTKIGVTLSFSTSNWFPNDRSAMPFFYVPISILVIGNVIFFILTVINIHRASQGSEILNINANRKMFRLCIKLFLVMGMCWMLEIISFIPKLVAPNEVDESLYYIPDIINCFQGVYIFTVYVFKKKTARMIREKLRLNSMTSNISLATTRTSSLASESAINPSETISTSTNTQTTPIEGPTQGQHSQPNTEV